MKISSSCDIWFVLFGVGEEDGFAVEVNHSCDIGDFVGQAVETVAEVDISLVKLANDALEAFDFSYSILGLMKMDGPEVDGPMALVTGWFGGIEEVNRGWVGHFGSFVVRLHGFVLASPLVTSQGLRRE